MPHNPDTFIESLVADLQPVAPLRQRSGMGLALLALTLGALGVAAGLGMRQDLLAGHPQPLAMIAAGLFLVLALASAWTAVDMARPAVGMRRNGWGWTALMAAVLPAAALILIAADVLRGQQVGLDRDGLTCLSLGSLVGLLTAGALVVWLRRGAPSSPQRAGLLTGVAAGAAGIFAVSLRCPSDSLLHIGVWHAGTVVLMGLVGRILLPRILAW